MYVLLLLRCSDGSLIIETNPSFNILLARSTCCASQVVGTVSALGYSALGRGIYINGRYLPASLCEHSGSETSVSLTVALCIFLFTLFTLWPISVRGPLQKALIPHLFTKPARVTDTPYFHG